MSSQYLYSNPLAEHNSGIALSDKQIPVGGTGNMYQGQGGRAFVQGGGGMSQYHSFAGGNPEDAYARGSYAPVSVGYNSMTQSGGKRRRKSRGSRKSRKSRKSIKSRKSGSRMRARKHKKQLACGCDIVTGFGSNMMRQAKHKKSCRYCHASKRSRHGSQSGGSAIYGNAAYSVAGVDTEVGRNTTALANPAPITAYNSCHPVA